MAGTPSGPNNTAIAGHAIATGAILVTNNMQEFEQMSGLMLEDWTREMLGENVRLYHRRTIVLLLISKAANTEYSGGCTAGKMWNSASDGE